MVKNPPGLNPRVGDLREVGLILGSGRFPGEKNDNPLQCSCLENPMDRGAWWATVHAVTEVRHDWAREHTQKLSPQRALYF